METVIIISIGLIGIGIAIPLFLIRSRIGPTYSVTAGEIPEVIRQLQQSGNHGLFAVLTFTPPGAGNSETLNLQYSLEAGVAGLDWILIGAGNIADQAKVSDFAARLGYQFEEREMNEVPYLRMTGDGIAEFGMRIIQDLYQLDPGTRLDLITEGFKWRPAKS